MNSGRHPSGSIEPNPLQRLSDISQPTVDPVHSRAVCAVGKFGASAPLITLSMWSRPQATWSKSDHSSSLAGATSRSSRCPVRSGRAFRAAEYSSRKASLSDRQLPPNSPSSRPRFPASPRMVDGRFLLPNATRFCRSAIHTGHVPPGRQSRRSFRATSSSPWWSLHVPQGEFDGFRISPSSSRNPASIGSADALFGASRRSTGAPGRYTNR